MNLLQLLAAQLQGGGMGAQDMQFNRAPQVTLNAHAQQGVYGSNNPQHNAGQMGLLSHLMRPMPHPVMAQGYQQSQRPMYTAGLQGGGYAPIQRTQIAPKLQNDTPTQDLQFSPNTVQQRWQNNRIRLQ